MAHCIARFIESLLRFLLPSPGRHWAPDPAAPAVPAADTPTAPPRCVPMLRGEDNRLVRPYLVAHERRQEERKRRARQRALVLATYGVDIGPRRIHGVEVTG